MKGTIIDVREKNTYRIRRVKAYRKYFWIVKDVEKGCFLWSGGGWHGVVTYKFPLEKPLLTKTDILFAVPGYFSSKKEAISCLEQGLRR